MKIYLLRHGEAEFGNPKGDFYRKLTPEGRKQLSRLAQILEGRKVSFDFLICSSSARTLETMGIIKEAVKVREILDTPDIYEADFHSLLFFLNGIPKEFQTVLLIGHNPGISALVEYLSGSGFINMSPGMMAVLDSSMDDWSYLGRETCSLSEIIQ